jgi:hypothetical protein
MDQNGQFVGRLGGNEYDNWMVVAAEETRVQSGLVSGMALQIETQLSAYLRRTYLGQNVPLVTTSGSGSSVRCSNSPALRLVVGGRGRVIPNTSANNLRASPETGSVLASIPAGGAFDVIGTYQCGASGGLTWWQVRYNGVTGWTAEGQGSTYWIEPI